MTNYFFRLSEAGFRRTSLHKKRLITNPGAPFWSVGAGVDIRCSLSTKLQSVCIEDFAQISLLSGSMETLEMGRCSYAGEIMANGRRAALRIGRFCSISSEVNFICGDGFHDARRLSSYPFPFRRPFQDLPVSTLYSESDIQPSAIVIGHDVWIGYRVTILKNVTIGNGAVIASGSVVTKDVPPYTIVAGTPAIIKKRRYNEDMETLIETLQWWNWPDQRIRDNIGLFRLTGNELRSALHRLACEGQT